MREHSLFPKITYQLFPRKLFGSNIDPTAFAKLFRKLSKSLIPEKMPRSRRVPYKTVTFTHSIRANTLQMRQELKEEVTKALIALHFQEVDFSQSVDHIQTMKNYLWRKYKSKFEYSMIRRHFSKITKNFRLARERAEAERA